MKFVSELLVGSLLVYPKGASTASGVAKAFIRYDIKQAQAGKIEYAIQRLREVLPSGPLTSLFPDAGILVPVPGHAPLYEGGLWVAQRISAALVAAGLGEDVVPLLRRTEAVPRSSSLSSGADRPDPREHFRTLSLDNLLVRPRRITLVDDVVTRGSTLIACATRIQAHYPEAEIAAFALARVAVVDLTASADMLAPLVETIRFDEITRFIQRA